MYLLKKYRRPDKLNNLHSRYWGKSFIVAVNKVDSIDGNNLQIGRYHIPVSRSLKEEVMSKFLEKRFRKMIACPCRVSPDINSCH